MSIAASPEAQVQAVEGVIEQARRLAARGADAVVLIDTLEWLPPHAARRVLAAARNIVDGGSLTVLATAPAALGGETSVIALDACARRGWEVPGRRSGGELDNARRAAAGWVGSLPQGKEERHAAADGS